MMMSAHLRPHTYTATTEHSLQNHGLCGKLSSHGIARDRAVRVNQFKDPLLVAVGIWPMVPRESLSQDVPPSRLRRPNPAGPLR